MFKIIYLYGHGRSGSTFFEQLLSLSLDQSFPIGESRMLCSKSLLEKYLCSCGEPIDDCNFWKSIVESNPLFSSNEKVNLFSQIISNLDKRRILTYLRTYDHTEYLEDITKFFEDIYTKSTCTYIIDSSKTIGYLKLLSNLPGFEIHVIQVVRDPRAVVVSRSNKKLRVDSTTTTAKYMEIIPSWKTSLWWIFDNLPIINANIKTHTVIKYESLILDSEKIMNNTLESIGFKQESKRVKTRVKNQYHTIFGNPFRLLTKEVEVIRQVPWQYKISFVDYIITTVLTLPFLWYYGYPISLPQKKVENPN